MSGGKGEQEVKTELPGFVKRPMQDYAGQLRQFPREYDPQFFPDQTYAPQSPITAGAIGGMAGAAGESQDYYRSVLGGDYLGLNPAMRSAVMDPAMDAAAARFNQMGRYGSPASQEAMARAGMQSLMPYYADERRMQQQAGALLPGAYQPQLQAGQLDEYYAQRPITEDIARWEFEQERPFNLMNRWQSLFGPLAGAGGTSTTTQPGGSPIAGALGGAATGAGVAKALSLGSPWGWGLAGLGAIGGLL